MARLSTHVLDVAKGMPARDVRIDLHRITEGHRSLVTTTTTNADGRTDRPLVEAERIETGVYELVFHAAAYFRASGLALPDPPFLDEVVIRVGLAEATSNYHVPLLLAPYGYSTYRGS